MANQPNLNINDVYRALQPAEFYGATAGQLLLYARELIDLLSPQHLYPGMNLLQRAYVTERLLRRATPAFGGISTEALEILLGLAQGMIGRPHPYRQLKAADLFERHPRTFGQGRYRHDLLYALAAELCRLYASDHGSDSAEPEPDT